MLLNLAAHNVKRKIVSMWMSHNVHRHKTLSAHNVSVTKHFVTVTFCDAVRYVMFTFWKIYVLELLRCVHLCFVTLRHVTFMLCWFTLCSNIGPFVCGTFCTFTGSQQSIIIKLFRLSACYSSSCQWWRALFSGISIFNNYIKRSDQPGICKGGGDCCI
jgi:hypothetical protein